LKRSPLALDKGLSPPGSADRAKWFGTSPRGSFPRPLSGNRFHRLDAREGATARPVPKTYPQESRGQLSAIPNVLYSSEFPCSTPRPPARVPPSYGGALRGSGRSRFAGSFADLRPPDSPVLLDLEGLGSHQKAPICRYLSPLPDSNRGPPPYHGGSQASHAYTRDHSRHSFSCKSARTRPYGCVTRRRACRF
jgi:hypothetical protein